MCINIIVTVTIISPDNDSITDYNEYMDVQQEINVRLKEERIIDGVAVDLGDGAELYVGFRLAFSGKYR